MIHSFKNLPESFWFWVLYESSYRLITSYHDTTQRCLHSTVKIRTQKCPQADEYWPPFFFGTIFRGGFIHIRCCGESLSVCVVVAMKEHVRPAAALWCALIVCVVIISDVQFPPTLHADVMNSEPQNISNIYCGADKRLLGEAPEYSGQRSVMRWIQVKHIFPLFNFWILISREQQQEIKQALTNLKCVFLTVLQLRCMCVCVRVCKNEREISERLSD